MEKFISHISGSNRTQQQEKEPGFGFEKANSTIAMNKWRSSITEDQVAIVDKRCGYLYCVLGFRQTHSMAELRSTNISLLLTDSFSGLFKPVL